MYVYQVSTEARRRFDGHWDDASLIPSDYKSIVYKIVLKNGGVKEYEAVLKTFYATEDNAEKRFAFTLGAVPSVCALILSPCPRFFSLNTYFVI